MFRLFALLLVLTSMQFTGLAQSLTVSGYVRDAKTGETLIGATVAVKERPGTGTVTNAYGYYALSLPPGNYTLVFGYLGYAPREQALRLTAATKLNAELEMSGQQLQEVVVTGESETERLRQTQMGVEKISIQTINKLPVLLGERDFLKSMQLLPGVKSAGEGQSGFSVRGGTLDQNLILLDDAPVYNASHLLGFFSTFNSDALKEVTLHKGTAPAPFGGRLASVVDVKMKDGNNQKFDVSGGIGLIASRLNVEGPIQEGKSSFLLSGRRTYADVFLRLNDQFAGNSLYFYDFNAKLNYQLSDKDHLFLSGYFGRDKFGLQDRFGIDWGNATGTLRYTRLLSDKLFLNSSLIYSNYDYEISISANENNISILSGIEDWNFKQEVQYFAGSGRQWRAGYNLIYHTVTPGTIRSNTANIEAPLRNGLESAAWFSYDWQLRERWKITAGLRVSHFGAFARNGNYFALDAENNVTDTLPTTGGFVAQYFYPEPRLAVQYTLDAVSSLKAAYTRNTQNLHLVTNSVTTSPTDRWLMSTNNIRPEIGDQFSLGYFRNSADNSWEFSAETYFKWMQNQVDYKDAADDQSPVIETQLLYGDGRAYGLELLAKKNKGRFTGWIGYTLSRTERQIQGVNNGSWYPARQDRTHDISIVGMFAITSRFDVSAAWVYQTGNAVTFPSGKYNVADKTIWLYTERNGYRMPAYHRLDLGATYQLKERRWYTSELTFSLYNAYGRQNPFLIEFRENPANRNQTQAVQTALFRWVPAISWNFNLK